ncbi:MAG: hypothetical protein AB2784_00300, partial [Candidatus Thiodiazotropha endolucinida]
HIASFQNGRTEKKRGLKSNTTSKVDTVKQDFTSVPDLKAEELKRGISRLIRERPTEERR